MPWPFQVTPTPTLVNLTHELPHPTQQLVEGAAQLGRQNSEDNLSQQIKNTAPAESHNLGDIVLDELARLVRKVDALETRVHSTAYTVYAALLLLLVAIALLLMLLLQRGNSGREGEVSLECHEQGLASF